MLPGFEQMTHDRSAHIPESASDEHSRHTRPPEAIRRGRAANASQFTYIVPLRISPHSVGNEGHEWRFDLRKDYETWHLIETRFIGRYCPRPAIRDRRDRKRVGSGKRGSVS